MKEEYNLNPYHNQTDSLANIPVTPLMIEHLRATRPWVKFLSIMMFISVGLCFLGGLLMMIASSSPVMRGAGLGPLIGLVYWVMGGLYLAPAVFLYRYASSIQDLLQGGGDIAMESALESQKSFWRFMGIMTLVVLCIYGLIILFGIFAAMSMRRF